MAKMQENSVFHSEKYAVMAFIRSEKYEIMVIFSI